MDCMFTRRQLKTLPKLDELFADMNIIYVTGKGSSTTARVNITQQDASTYIPTSGVCYILSFCNGYLGVWKVVNKVIQSTPIKQIDTQYGGIVYINNSGTYCSYYDNGYHESTSSTAGTVIYGATLALVEFPSYSDKQIDAVLSAGTYSRLAGRNASSSAYVRTDNKSHAYYIAVKASNADIWSCDSATWTKITGTDSAAASAGSTYLSCGSVYGGSIIGVDAA